MILLARTSPFGVFKHIPLPIASIPDWALIDPDAVKAAGWLEWFLLDTDDLPMARGLVSGWPERYAGFTVPKEVLIHGVADPAPRAKPQNEDDPEFFPSGVTNVRIYSRLARTIEKAPAVPVEGKAPPTSHPHARRRKL